MAGLVAFLVNVTAPFSKAMVVDPEDVTEETTEATTESNNGQFLVNIRYGIDSLVKYSANVPVQVTVTNTGKDFTGEMTMTEIRSTRRNVGYSRDISIAEGETKAFSMNLANAGDFTNCKVRILNEKKKILFERTILDKDKLEISNNNTFVGILSDDYAALNYIDGAVIGINGNGATSGSDYDVKKYMNNGLITQSVTSSYVTNGDNLYLNLNIGQMDEETMPDLSASLSCLNFIIIDNFDTSKLSDEQYRALKDWVSSGGVLIIGTGANYNKTLSKFKDDFVTGDVGGLNKKNVNFNISAELLINQNDPATFGEDYASNADSTEEEITGGIVETPENEESTEDLVDSATEEAQYSTSTQEKTLNLDLADIKLTDGEPVAGGVADVAEIAQMKKYGLGAVIVCEYALGMEPYKSYDGKMHVLNSFINEIKSVGVRTSLFNGFVGSGAGSNGMENVDTSFIESANDSPRPQFGGYMILFLIYVVLVGPVCYLVLKKMDKRKALWIAIPAIALVFTVGVYVVSANGVVRNTIVDIVSIEEIEDGIKNEVLAFNIRSPKSSAYSLELSEKVKNVQPLNTGYYSNSFWGVDIDSAETTAMIKDKIEHSSIEISKGQAFSSHYFSATRSDVTTEDIDYDIQYFRDHFEGSITNNLSTDLEKVIVYFYGNLAYIEEIKAGETVNITEEMCTANVEFYDVPDVIYNKNGQSGYDPDTYDQINELRNLTYILQDRIESISPHGDGLIYGYRIGDTANITDGKHVDEYSKIAVVKEFTPSYRNISNNYSRNIHTEYLRTSTGDWDTQRGYMYDMQEIEAEYDFGSSGINTLYFMGDREENVNIAECLILNPNTGAWDRLFIGNSGEETDISNYFLDDAHRIIKLKFKSAQPGSGDAVVPTISGGEE